VSGCEREGDLLDVLGGGSEQALTRDGDQSAEAGVAVAMELLGVGEGAFDGLLAPAVDAFAPWVQAVSVGALAGIGPDVAGDHWVPR